MTIILPAGTSSAAPSPSVFSHPSNLIYVHASLSDLSPVCPPHTPPPPPYQEIATIGDTDRLSTLDQCLRTLVADTSGAFLGPSDSDRTALKFLNYHFCSFYVFIRDLIDNSPDSHTSLAVPPPDICD